MWVHPKTLFLIIFNAIIGKKNWNDPTQKRLDSSFLKIQHPTQEAPIHWASLADDPEEVTVSPKFCGIQLRSKEHQGQSKLKGQSPADPVGSAAMHRLHSSAQQTSNGNLWCFSVTPTQPSVGYKPCSAPRLADGSKKHSDILKELGLSKSPQKA